MLLFRVLLLLKVKIEKVKVALVKLVGLPSHYFYAFRNLYFQFQTHFKDNCIIFGFKQIMLQTSNSTVLSVTKNADCQALSHKLEYILYWSSEDYSTKMFIKLRKVSYRCHTQ